MPNDDLTMGALLHDLNSVEDTSERIISRIPEMSEEALTELHRYAQEIGRQAWRIGCAVCATVVQRDTDRGLKAAYVNEMAQRLGCTATTIYRNAQTFDLAQSQVGMDVQTILPEKTFFEEALRHVEDPPQALTLIADKRGDDPRYSARDARRDVRALRQGAEPAVQREVFWLSVGLMPVERLWLNALTLHWECDQATATKRALQEAFCELQASREPIEREDTGVRSDR